MFQIITIFAASTDSLELSVMSNSDKMFFTLINRSVDFFVVIVRKYTDFHKNPNTSKKLSHFVHIIGSDMEEMIKISTKTINVILPFLPFENNVSSNRILLC